RRRSGKGVDWGLLQFRSRTLLTFAHDLAATAVAVLAAFYIRFEEAGLAERAGWLGIILSGFVLYAALIHYVFRGYTSKWRFTSLPDLMNILRISTVLAFSLFVLDYVLVAPNLYGTFFFGKITILLYWLLQMFFLAGTRVVYRYFRYTRTRHHARMANSNPVLIVGLAADAEVLLRAIESGAVTKI